MKNIFIIAANLNNENVKIFTEYLKCYQCGWWHWFDNFWIIIDDSGKLSSTVISRKIHEIQPEEHTLVFRVDNISEWHGWGLTDNETYFGWLRDNIDIKNK